MKDLYQLGFDLWASFIDAATKMFTLDPMSGGGGLSSALHAMKLAYNALQDIAIPLAIICCMLSLLKVVVSTPPEHQARAFIGTGIKFVIIIALSANMWTIMGWISQVCTGVVNTIQNSGVTASYGTLHFNQNMLTAIDHASTWQGGDDVFELIKNFFGDLLDHIALNVIGFVFAVIYLFIVVACGVVIVLTAFQRIFKPMVILPFSTIAIATGAGGPEVGRTMSSYFRTYIGFVLSGAIMVLAISLSSTFTGLIQFNITTSTDIATLALGSIEMALVPVITTGLVKGADQIISKALAL